MTDITTQTYLKTSDGAKLFVKYCVPCKSNNQTMLLIHGYSSSSQYWTCNQRDFCNEGYRVITYDQRGHGKSSKQNSLDYSAQRLVLDAQDVANSFGGPNPIVIGESLGAGVALAWAAGLVPNVWPMSKMILCDGSAAPFNLLAPTPIIPNIGLTPDALAAAASGNLTAFGLLTLNDICTKNIQYLQMVQGLDALSAQASLYALSQIFASTATVNLIPLLVNVNIPTLVLHGNIDAVFPFNGAALYLYTHIANSQLAGIPNRGHNAVITDYPGSLQMMRDFLGNICQVCYLV